MLTRQAVDAWVAAYRRAWESNDPADIKAALAEGAAATTPPPRHSPGREGWDATRSSPLATEVVSCQAPQTGRGGPGQYRRGQQRIGLGPIHQQLPRAAAEVERVPYVSSRKNTDRPAGTPVRSSRAPRPASEDVRTRPVVFAGDATPHLTRAQCAQLSGDLCGRDLSGPPRTRPWGRRDLGGPRPRGMRYPHDPALPRDEPGEASLSPDQPRSRAVAPSRSRRRPLLASRPSQPSSSSGYSPSSSRSVRVARSSMASSAAADRAVVLTSRARLLSSGALNRRRRHLGDHVEEDLLFVYRADACRRRHPA